MISHPSILAVVLKVTTSSSTLHWTSQQLDISLRGPSCKSELKVRGGIEDNSQISFLISQ